MRKTKKRGFTVVELVIVIAVIAVLAAVLIPTFSSISRKANLSSDKSAVREMNMALAADEALNGKPQDIETVMKVLANAGYNSDNWVCLTTGYEVYWFKEDNRLVLYNAKEAAVEYPEEYDAKVMTNANNHFFLYNENNQKAVKFDFSLSSSQNASGTSYLTLENGKGKTVAQLGSSSASEQANLTAVSTALTGNTALKSSVLGNHNDVYVYGNREVTTTPTSKGNYVSMQIMSVGGTETPPAELTSGVGDVKENVFYISVKGSDAATLASDSEVQAAAGEMVYTIFTKINAGQITGEANVILESGITLDVSDHEWAPVKEFTGYFGSTDPSKPIVIDGARLTDATGYASTVGFTGSQSKYFVTGFFGTVYGTTTIENVTFKNMTLNEPATDYVLSQTDIANKKVNSRNCIGIIGGITDKGLSDSCRANVTLRNIVVEDSVNIVAGATAGGLVGYIGGAGDTCRAFGTVTIEGCTVSAKLTSNYIAASTSYGPMGGFIGLACRTVNSANTDGISLVFKGTNTFNGSVDGHQNVSGIIGDIQDIHAIDFQGTFNMNGTLNGKNMATKTAAAYSAKAYCFTGNTVTGAANVNFSNTYNFGVSGSQFYNADGSKVA